jgi:serine/threonine-protein kinase
MAGDIIGSYRVLRKIGEGGMGAVYLAEHTLLGRPAAIKVLLREMSHREDLVTRFFNEARAASSVKHPGIVEIYDFGHHTDGSAYIVMEYLEGESLSARLRRTGVLSEARAVALCRQVGGALAAAHAKGIVHRDLKPDNIFIVRDSDIADGERAKVLDFGIAKLASDPSGQPSMTRTGMVMGTPAYMAPEQCKGAGNVDQRSDLYALGCILFELVCGRPPFIAEGAGEVMAHHIFTPVPAPSSVAPVTPLLEHIILRALAKEPDQRFRSAEDMLAALQAVVPSGSFARAAATDATMMAVGGPVRANPSTPGSWAPSVPSLVAPRTAPSLPGVAHATAQTTMSGAAGATVGTTLAVRRRSWALPMAAVLVIGGGIGAFAVVQGRSGQDMQAARPPAPAPKPPEPAPRTPEPAPKPPEPAPDHGTAPIASPPPSAPPPAAAPAKVTLTIASDPAGAEVYRMPQGIRVGETPLRLPIDAVSGELVLLLQKPGYRDQTITMPADHDGDQAVKLVRKSGSVARPAGGTARPGADPPTGQGDFFTRTPAPPAAPSPPSPPPPSGSLDPFAKPKK